MCTISFQAAVPPPNHVFDSEHTIQTRYCTADRVEDLSKKTIEVDDKTIFNENN